MNRILAIVSFLFFLSPCIKPQQNYSKTAVFDCNGESFPYICNGQHSSCRAYLIFTAYSPYNTLLAIAALTSSDPTQISIINNVTTFSVFPEGQEVVVPVNCTCSGHHYEAITSYSIFANPQTYFTIANKTYQGLSTCSSLMRANTHPESTLLTGHKLRVPLRCACPTRKQGAVGTKFLLTYSIAQGDTLYALSKRFNASLVSIIEANSLSHEISTIFPFTTILIPLPGEPSHSQTVSRDYNVTASSYLPPSPVRDVKSRSKRLLSIVGIAIGAFFLLIFFLSALIILFHKKIIPQSRGKSPQDLINLEIASLDRALKEFKFSEIKKATGNFGSKSKINGSVHRATFKREVLAVKKSKGGSDNEMKVLCKINHFNIVKLCGFCEHKDDLYLVYEYMANGSLQDWLSRRGKMSWIQRICIALDVANGLLYLHNFASPAYVHNDVNSHTILLDGNLRAKIAHFSLARPANYEDTTKVMGSKGYLAPESRDAGPTTLKVDVFAFGVILLELMTELDGRKIASILESQNAETELSQFISPEIGGMEEYAVQMMKLSLCCLVQEPGERPSMVEVVSILLKMQCNIHKACCLSKQQEN